MMTRHCTVCTFRTGLVGAALVLGAAGAEAQVQAQYSPELTVTFGVKLWATAWQSWVSQPGAGVALGTSRYQIVQLVEGNEQASFIPAINLRQGRWLLATSVMPTTRFVLRDLATPNGFDVKASRSEADATLGYAALPNFYLTGGVKQLRQTYGGDNFRWRGPFIGLTGSADLGRQWYVYGNVTGGILRAQFPASQVDVNGSRRFNADYRLGEFGLAFAPNWSGSASLRAPVFTVGYRSQYVATKRYALAVTDLGVLAPRFNAYANLYDTTRGFTVGVAMQF